MEGGNGMLSLKQVAERLNIAYVTLYYNYIRTGKIRSVKLDGIYRVEEKDLEDFIQSRKAVIK